MTLSVSTLKKTGHRSAKWLIRLAALLLSLPTIGPSFPSFCSVTPPLADQNARNGCVFAAPEMRAGSTAILALIWTWDSPERAKRGQRSGRDDVEISGRVGHWALGRLQLQIFRNAERRFARLRYKAY
ncbi:hypothetical protein P5V15_010597 [Pogonomyrmex californicus]